MTTTNHSPGALPRVLFLNINGNGMGHLSRCLAYARRMRGRARPVFLSMASAVDVIHEMGFEADYFISNVSSSADHTAWDREFSIRLGLMLEEMRPEVVVFDGTWPFAGLLRACRRWGRPRTVWSNRGLHKDGAIHVPVKDTEFDLVLQPGEIGSSHHVISAETPGRKVVVPPVTLLDDSELLEPEAARAALGLEARGRYALFALGPGNVKDISDIGSALIGEVRGRGYTVVWTRMPISMRDLPLPEDVMPLTVYPLVRYMRAFDLFVGAAGYNTCCEILQARIPSLLVPNLEVIDDQTRRAQLVAESAPVVISACETAAQRAEAVSALLALELDAARDAAPASPGTPNPGAANPGAAGLGTASPRATGLGMASLGGSEIAAEEILALVAREAAA